LSGSYLGPHPSGCNKAVCRCAVCLSVAKRLASHLPKGSSSLIQNPTAASRRKQPNSQIQFNPLDLRGSPCRGVRRRLAVRPYLHHNGSFSTSKDSMPTNITLKAIPDEVYNRLKSSAEANHRSLNSEVIACLETVLLPKRTSATVHLAAIRAIRARLPQAAFDHDAIDSIKRKGRA
jgi:antitoxin FitA